MHFLYTTRWTVAVRCPPPLHRFSVCSDLLPLLWFLCLESQSLLAIVALIYRRWRTFNWYLFVCALWWWWCSTRPLGKGHSSVHCHWLPPQAATTSYITTVSHVRLLHVISHAGSGWCWLVSTIIRWLSVISLCLSQQCLYQSTIAL